MASLTDVGGSLHAVGGIGIACTWEDAANVVAPVATTVRRVRGSTSWNVGGSRGGRQKITNESIGDLFLLATALPRKPARNDVIEILSGVWAGRWRIEALGEPTSTGEYRCKVKIDKTANQIAQSSGHPRPGIPATIPPTVPTVPPISGDDGSSVTLLNAGAVPIEAGQPVSYVTGPAMVLANAASPATLVDAFALEPIAPGMTGRVTADGHVDLTDWSGISDAAALVTGQAYFLTDTDGRISIAAAVAPNYSVRVGHAVTPTRLDIEISQPVKLN